MRSTSGHLIVPHGWVASDNILARPLLTVMRTQTQRTLLALLHLSTMRLMIYMAGSENDFNPHCCYIDLELVVPLLDLMQVMGLLFFIFFAMSIMDPRL